MKELMFEGYKNYCFGEYGCTEIDYDTKEIGEVVVFYVYNKEGGVKVFGQYLESFKTWLIGTAKLDDNTKMPDWKIYFKERYRLSNTHQLVIEAPNDVKVVCTNNKNKEAA